jgi:hypothetical protein
MQDAIDHQAAGDGGENLSGKICLRHPTRENQISYRLRSH